MCCTPTRFVNITIRGGCGGFMPFPPMFPGAPIGGFYHHGWNCCNPGNIFAFGAGIAIGGLAFRGLQNLLHKNA